MREGHVQYYVYHKVRKILKGPFSVVNMPRWFHDEFARQTFDAYPEGDPLKGDPNWVGGTLDKILRMPGVERDDISRGLGIRKD